MERLTEWIDDGEHRQAIPKTDIRNNGHNKCCNKLAEYEDLEEQGLLVRLPFKLCRLKKIYYFVEIDIEKDIMPEDIICEAIAEEFIIDRYDIVIKCITGVWSDYEYLLAKNMGKSVFLTREEAEKKLEEMKTNG